MAHVSIRVSDRLTVYICEKISCGNDIGQRAIMKIRTECVHHLQRNCDKALLNISEYQQQPSLTLTLNSVDRFQKM